jgi:hypothetical protein
MEKEFIPYDLAMELKELGFDEPCFKGYTEEYKTLINFSNPHTNKGVKNTLPTKPFTAPLYQQSFRWFRENFNLDKTIITNFSKDYKSYRVGIIYVKNNIIDTFFLRPENEKCLFIEFNTYEEAELACLKKLIEIVKQK